MYYYKARIYSPTLGRFLQTDPIGYEDQYNLYAYVANDPINMVDPTGLKIAYEGERAEDLQELVKEYQEACDECAEAVQSLEDSENTHIFADASVITDRKGERNLANAGGAISVPFPRGKANDRAASNGDGTGTLVIIDLDTPHEVDGVEYSQTSRLGHEIDHSVHSDSGTLPRTKLERENSAIDAANKYRSAVGESLRPRLKRPSGR